MRTFRLGKLVKDSVFESMQESGQGVDFRILDDDEFAAQLRSKIVEEALEFQESGDRSELIDILEVVKAALHQIDSPSDTQITVHGRPIKHQFMARIFVNTVTLQDDDSWMAYYDASPERFPELIVDHAQGSNG